MRASETRQQHVMDGLDGDRDLSINWDLEYPELGNAVEIVTQYMRVIVWLNHEGYLEDVSHCLLLLNSFKVFSETALYALDMISTYHACARLSFSLIRATWMM